MGDRLSTTELLRQVKNILLSSDEYKNEFHIDEVKSTIDIDVSCAITGNGTISFHISPDLYFINVVGVTTLNFTENQQITAQEAMGDLEDIFKALNQGLSLAEHSLFGLKAYSVIGLDSRRFARTKTIKELLVTKLGKIIRIEKIILAPH